MKRFLCLLILICAIFSGCMQNIEPEETPTVAVTKRVIEQDTPAPTPTPTAYYPLLTPKNTDASEPDLDVFGIEISGNSIIAGINLSGNSVDLISSILITSITFGNTGINFIELSHDEITALENKYLTSIYYAVRISNTQSGTYVFNVNVMLKDGSTESVTLYGNITL